MGKVEEALRELVQYHGRRAASHVLGKVPALVRQLRREVRDLRKEARQLQADVKALTSAHQQEMAVPPAPEEDLASVRISPRSLKSMRKRFGLTQQELARLLEVSTVTVTTWESGRSRPRKANLAQIVTLRGMSQSEVDAALGRSAAPPSVKPEDLKRLRKKHQLTQAELAVMLGVSPASVTSWEAGKTEPREKNRSAIAELASRLREEAAKRSADGAGAGAPAPDGPLSADGIKALRQQAGLSQKELARQVGVSVNSVSNWETGRTAPRAASVRKLLELAAQ